MCAQAPDAIDPGSRLGVADSAIAAMAALLDLRDGYAAADAEQMVDTAMAVGRRTGLGCEELEDLRAAARLHDIGKIGVPDRILHKAGKLGADERLVMQRHPVWGADAIARIPGMGRVASIVRAHHERWDGLGYPRGLAGEEIPLESRIVGLCETYRALTSERPYRRALPAGAALGIVEAGAGAHFDPAVVAAFTAVLAEAGIRRIERVDAATARRRALAGERSDGPRPSFGRRLPAALARLAVLPALAESRDRLLDFLRAERPSGGAIVATVESDLALAIAVLRLANGRSGNRGRIGSIPDAVQALSPEGIEMLASRIAVVDVLDANAAARLPEPARAHALAVRRAADRLVSEVSWRDADELLIAALLHDVGKLALLDAYPGYPEALHRGARTPEARLRAERHELGVDHAALGGTLLRRWGLPDRLAETVERHHDANAGEDAALVRLADQLAHQSQGHPVDPAELLACAAAVGLDGDRLRSVMYDIAAGGTLKPRRSEPCPLTDKELAVVRELAAGKLYKEIGRSLGLATSTVRSHLHKAYNRLGVADRAQAVLLCTEQGWL